MSGGANEAALGARGESGGGGRAERGGFAGEDPAVRSRDREIDGRREPAALLREAIELSVLGEELRLAGERARRGRG